MATAKSIVFESPPPTYVYQNAFFETRIKVIHPQAPTPKLQFTLRYHDTYDVVPDQTIMNVDENSTTVDGYSNVCVLRLALHQLTISYEGRPFCIEVRSVEGDLESVFSTPIYVVKEKLRITEQPPDVWFKDEGGREKCMVVSAILEAAPGVSLEDRVVPLQLKLLYESGAPVVNQSILRLFPDMRPNMSNGRVSISFRIDDVSKNHQGQSFVLQIVPEKQQNSFMFQDIAPVQTSVISIRSKRNKRKLNGCTPRSVSSPITPMTSPTAQRPRHLGMMSASSPYVLTPHPNQQVSMMPVAGRGTWSSHIQSHPTSQPPTHQQSPSVAMPNSMEWKLAAFEIHPDGSANVSRPIYRCTHCNRLVDRDMLNHGQDIHAPQCMYNQQSYSVQYYSTPRTQTQQSALSSPPLSDPFNSMVETTPVNVMGKQEGLPTPVSTTHRPALAISPYMNKSTDDTDGNLFASNAFRSQMGLFDLNVDEKLDLMDKEPLHDMSSTGSNNMDSSSLIVSVGPTNSLFSDMSSMDTSIDTFFHTKTGLDFQSVTENNSDGGNSEDQVFYIHACMYNASNGKKLGLPTFDKYEQMVGFYWESQTDAQTEVIFRPLSELIGFTNVEKDSLTTQFQAALRQNSEAVHSLPKYQHNLVQLREDALMYYWSQSIQCLA